MGDFAERTGIAPYRYDGPIYGGFGHLTVIGDGVECHVCGHVVKSLIGHAFMAHGMTAVDYREEFRIPEGVALRGPRLALDDPRCKRGHSLADNPIVRADGKGVRCRACNALTRKEWKKRHPEKERAIRRNTRAKANETRKAWRAARRAAGLRAP